MSLISAQSNDSNVTHELEKLTKEGKTAEQAAREEKEREGEEVLKDSRKKMDAFDILRSQYIELKGIFDDFAKTGSGCVRTRRLLLEDLGEKLENHIRLKEKIFVPLYRKASDAGALQTIEEMALIRALLRRITRLDVADKSLSAKMKLLEQLVSHHIDAEEARAIPSILEKNPFENFERLGLRMQEEYKKLQGLHERRLRLREHRRWLASRQNTARQLFGRPLPFRDDLASVTF